MNDVVRWGIVIFAGLLAACAANASAEMNPFYDKSYAVVVGIDRYSSPNWPPLTYAVKDAKGVADLLTRKGFEVVTLYNEQATRNGIIKALQNDLAPKLKPRDRVVFFYAGHGHTESRGGKEWGYVVPYDGTVSAEFIAMEDLQRQSEVMGEAKHQLFVMDSCYGGLLGLRGLRIAPERPGYLGEITRRQARHVFTAGGADQQVADSGPGGHSVFTGYFLKAIDDGEADLNGDGWVTFSEIQSYVTPAASTGIQTPGISFFPSHEQGEIVFRGPSGRSETAVGADVRTARSPSLRSRGGVLAFNAPPAAGDAKLALALSSLVCEHSNDPQNEDEIYIEIEGRLPDNQRYAQRMGTWERVCTDPDAIPVPVELWAGRLQDRDRVAFVVRIREEDKLSGPEDVLAFQFDARMDDAGDLRGQVVGLPVLEDTQRDQDEMAITLVSRPGDASGTRAAVLSADYIRKSLLIDKRVSYKALLSW